MADKFQNKYRIASARLQAWDFSWQGAYFITICTKNRSHYFGKIVNNTMELTNVGELADVFWHEIKNHSKDITLGEFIVMPNHIQYRHGMPCLYPIRMDIPIRRQIPIWIKFPRKSKSNFNNPNRTNRLRNPGKNSISSLIGGYKSAVTKHANRLKLDFGWQTRFYDHIIRDERAFNTISNYIKNNPKNGEKINFVLKFLL